MHGLQWSWHAARVSDASSGGRREQIDPKRGHAAFTHMDQNRALAAAFACRGGKRDRTGLRTAFGLPAEDEMERHPRSPATILAVRDWRTTYYVHLENSRRCLEARRQVGGLGESPSGKLPDREESHATSAAGKVHGSRRMSVVSGRAIERSGSQRTAPHDQQALCRARTAAGTQPAAGLRTVDRRSVRVL